MHIAMVPLDVPVLSSGNDTVDRRTMAIVTEPYRVWP